MIGLIQRVTHASVVVEGRTTGSIEEGLMVLVGVEKDDDGQKVSKLADKLLNYRVFGDSDGRMNASLIDCSADLLLVPQFTLVADTRKGLRPGFSNGAKPADATRLFDELVACIASRYKDPATGIFGADMKVTLCNDGPVTFWLQV